MMFVSWSEFIEISEKMADKLSGADFDSILCINRGGLVLGRILSDALGLPLGVVSASSYKKGEPDSRGKLELDKSISIACEAGKKVLLVDDIADSGSTFLEVVKFLENNGFSVKTAAIFKKKGCRYDVDILESAGVDDWIVMPYEANEFKGCDRK